MINGKTYYQILGVLEDAEEIIIRAAFRSLIQKYHPDKWVGDKNYANEKTIQLNRAYKTLSDPKEREEYDKTIGKDIYKNDIETEISDAITEAWEKAIKFYPELTQISAELSQISSSLQLTFKIAVTEKRQFEDSQSLANALKEKYLRRYFGTNKDVQTFALFLLKERNQSAAKELNKVVAILGDDATSERIISRVCDEYGIKNFILPFGKVTQDAVIAAREFTNLKISLWNTELRMQAAVKLVTALGVRVEIGFWHDTFELNGKLLKFGGLGLVKYCEDVAKKITIADERKTNH